MADAAAAVVAAWISKAERDLASASRLLDGTPPYPDTAVYHCQQAGEKALKAYLAAHGRPIRRVHDLVLLIDTCVGLDASFSQLAEAAEILTPYGTTFRYPGAATEPHLSDALEAIDCATRILDHVRMALYG
ncbi:HEPN domain-containing protein [Thiocapsa imhoffii]|nr:HEPN domain-containing protein [Thiocapsa imhoffii]